jgi:hypothetical protein
MIKKALLAGTLAAGLILPAFAERSLVQVKAGLILPPKPAIIKPENLEFSKHMLAMPFTMGMLAPKQASQIQFVGGNITSKAGATSGNSTIALNSGLTGGISSSVSNGDLVLAVFATGSTADRTLSITDGTNNYTLVGTELYSNDSTDTNLRVAYKFVSGDTSVTFGPTGSTNDAGAMAVYVFRGVHPTTPLDVAAVTDTNINTGAANPPSITPVTAGSFIVAIGASGSFSTYTFTSSELVSFRTVNGSGVNDITLGIGHKNDWTSGAFDPVAFGLSDADSTGNSWAAITLALRRA